MTTGIYASVKAGIAAVWNNKPYAVIVVSAAVLAYYHLALKQPVPQEVWDSELAVLGVALHSSIKNS